MSKIKLYLDEDVFPSLAEILRERGYDVVCASEVKMRGCSDEENFQFAIQNKRTILTFNISDYVNLVKKYDTHYGVLVSPQRNLKELLRKLLLFLGTHTPENARNRIHWI